MQIGFIGLGKMGSRMVSKLLQEGHEILVWNRSREAVEEFKIQNSKFKNTIQNVKFSSSVEDLVKSLQKPRIVWLMLPAGDPTESILNDIAKYVDPHDIVIDGGNAFYKDTQRRYETFAIDNVRYLGVGVSGGLLAYDNGYPLMVGGNKSAYEEIIPILDSLSKPNANHHYFGEGGAGHFVKMVHNGIEYGMMQAIGEGLGVLDKAGYDLDLDEVTKLWQKGTIVSGFLMDRAKDVLEKNPELENMDGIIGASGEGQWTVEQGKEESVPVGNIEQALNFRLNSQIQTEIQQSFAARMVNALRHEFGGHQIERHQFGEQSEDLK